MNETDTRYWFALTARIYSGMTKIEDGVRMVLNFTLNFYIRDFQI